MEWSQAAVTGDAVRRARAMAEFEEWDFVARHHGRRVAEIDRSDEIVLSKELARREVTLEVAQALHVTEHQVWAMVREAATLQAKTPAIWRAFAAGDIDGVRVTAIADTADRLVTPKALTQLEQTAPEYAATHTIAELRAWLRRLRRRLEPEGADAETARALEDRRVSVTHLDDGTSWLSALLPTPVAIVIAQRLRKTAKTLPTLDPETGQKDRRTREQKQADILAHWLTSSTGTSTDIRAEIAISIHATDLLGHTNGPGATLDGEPVSAAWVRELAASEHTIFRRLVLDPMGHVLDTSILGYRPSQRLRDAVRWRDGICRVIGCRAPAHESDQDHALAYASGGETSGSNLQSLCRKHHNMKSHGHLHDRHLDAPTRHVETHTGPEDA